jgi:hypothetical protein
MRACRIPLAVLLVLAGTAVAGDGDAPQDQPAKFKITTKRKDDSVAVKVEKDMTVFAVKSPFGISQAVIERTDDKWPAVVALRLHLKGLESFRASNGSVTLGAAVSVQDGKPKVRCGRTARRTPRWTRKAPSGWTFAP